MSTQGVRPGSDYLAHYRRLETTDLDCAREAVGRMWEHHRSHLLRGRTYAIAWHQADLIASTLSYVRTSSSIRLDCGPVSDAFRLTLHESGRINHWIDGRPAASTPGRAVLHVPGQGLRLETEPFRLLILSFSADAVRDALRVHRGASGEAVVWPTELPLATPAAKSLRALCRWAARELDRPGAGALAGAEAKRAIETTLLMLFLDCALDPSAQGKVDWEAATEARVRRVEEWIEAGFAEPVTVDHLARVAGISVRALQNACRRWRGCTPMELLRRRRLHAARQALLRAGPGGTVTAVATGCGFFNFGRFAGDYRRQFGETPSQTLAARAASTTALGRGRKTHPADGAFEG
ncbi:MAG: AraC family transcriptional regulator [Rhodospirillales bacterium]|nr:AraC family transcriptional regulator [Rhodospirillales bacterium]